MISILIPVCNEEELLESSLGRVHQFLESRALEHEVIVVSNGSSDLSNQILERLAGPNGWLRYFVLPERSVGRAFARGISEARGETVISLDADLSFDLQFIEYAQDLLRHADMVVGSKTMGRQRRFFLRAFASQMYILFAQLLFDLTISDYSIGCKAYRRAAVLPALGFIDDWTGYVLELCLYLNRSGKRIVQIGVDCDDRRRSKFNLLHEGAYRYWHLFRCWRKLHSGKGWLSGATGP